MISRLALTSALALLFCFTAASTTSAAEKTVDIGNGIVLHYQEQGHGPTIIFAHGSLSDYSYWQSQMAPFAAHYHVIAYSRRYNPPNHNPARPGYSAITDSDDLAALIKTLHLGKVYLIGHSYGALTGLFLAVRHPELLKAAVLAEPPAMNLLLHVPGEKEAEGQRMYADVRSQMVEPMRAAFQRHDSEKGVAIFINYVFRDPHAWDRMPAADRKQTLDAAHEWEVMLPRGTFFPPVAPAALKSTTTPILLMSGGKSYPFLSLTDLALKTLLPDSKQVVFEDAGHQMWLRHPDRARAYAEDFFAAHP